MIHIDSAVLYVIDLPAMTKFYTPIKLVFAVPDIEAERKRPESLGAKMLVRSWGAIRSGNSDTLHTAGAAAQI